MGIFKIKRQLTHGEQVSAAQQKSRLALGMFTAAHEILEETNADLEKVAEEARYKAEELLRHVERANSEINMNKAVQERLKDFIPQT